MSSFAARITLSSPNQTTAFAERLGARLEPGDVLLLEGSIGAGKTHFARSLIQSRMAYPEDVPSPTFTLVQIYETDTCEIWHADLYRLSTPDEVVELGLTEAFDTAICLVEWPDRLGALTPTNALRLAFAQGKDEDEREVTLTWTCRKWATRLEGAFHD
ncbi:MAG: tRNA (adenosine(37)-N6)-threonylcarbamoyltransferase complex ATPase subunit type 1 TsaE [Rhodobacterales bacterium]|nr:tRNA (adenosine(37)-N6)-threonylcarbamoyltransferase complex ATPase subunit type 1 TsaE [Rhodobacterales bacterium]MDX5391164.1 tRNA (adenosine(37)-N6)-threonylcarbamoyltransferase complex ATPase subunit type 1 TsaE [Rhodobacterales bacterium]MDX5490857.1 tRNA (adenosine(37)-N6)-threonylcarbamoyltransferase complex ATPase subunit type 1 TsaE [Rhodobacterales bacterium]